MNKAGTMSVVVMFIIGLLLGGTSFAADMGKELTLQPQSGPTLEETMGWIGEKLSNIHVNMEAADKCSRSSKEMCTFILRRSYQDVTANGCSLQFKIFRRDSLVDSSGDKFEDYEGNDRYVSCQIDLKTLGRAELLKVNEREDMEKSGVPLYALNLAGAVGTCTSDVYLTDGDLGQRLVKAMSHAAKMCGAQIKEKKKELF